MSVEDFIKKQGKVDQKLLDEVEKKLGKKLSRRLRGAMGKQFKTQQPQPMVVTLTKDR